MIEALSSPAIRRKIEAIILATSPVTAGPEMLKGHVLEIIEEEDRYIVTLSKSAPDSGRLVRDLEHSNSRDIESEIKSMVDLFGDHDLTELFGR